MFAGEFDREALWPRQIALDQLTLLRFRFALVGAHIQVRMLPTLGKAFFSQSRNDNLKCLLEGLHHFRSGSRADSSANPLARLKLGRSGLEQLGIVKGILAPQ